MFSWITFLLICSFAPLNHGGVYIDIPTGVKYHVHAKEAIFKTFEIDNMVIDCIDIYKQPTFQHPLLVNHTLQLKSNYPNKRNDFATEASYLWNSSKSCPEGYIPIERIIRNGQFTGDILKVHSHKYLDYADDGGIHEHSIIRASNNHFYGGKATLNVWNPKVDSESSFSLAQLWITSENSPDTLEAGWMVYPRLFGDAETRFFIFRTPDGYRTLCINLACPGFVQTNHQVILGDSIKPVSVYEGQQYTVDIEIFQDKITGNWWVRLQGADVGYWAKEVAPTLAEGATMVDFGGEIAFKSSSEVHPIIEMGSGHFSSEDFKKASFFANVQVLDSSYEYKTPVSIQAIKGNEGCYDILVGEDREGMGGLYFFYGGPGNSSETCQLVK